MLWNSNGMTGSKTAGAGAKGTGRGSRTEGANAILCHYNRFPERRVALAGRPSNALLAETNAFEVKHVGLEGDFVRRIVVAV